VSESPALFIGDFIMHLYSVDSDEAMKRESFIASLLQRKSLFNASSLLF
jgi:hypothetical protein